MRLLPPLRLVTIVCAAALVLAAPASAPGEDSGAVHYLVFELADNGSVRQLHAETVQARSPLRSISQAEQGRRLTSSGRQRSRVAVTLRDGTGRAVHRGTVDVPRWVRGEFLADDADDARAAGRSNIDGHIVAAASKPFVVRVPAVEGATLSLESELITRSTALDLDLLVGGAASSLLAGPPAAPFMVETLPGWDNGDPANRVDLLIMGDGYTAAEQAEFEGDVLDLVSAFFDVTPYDEYRNYVNVSMLFTASSESGADQPPYDASCTEYARVQSCCGDSSAVGEGSNVVSTAFDATFCSYDVQRLVTVNVGKVFAAAAAAPDWDEILVLVNDPTYGGSGGSVATISTHPLAVDVAQHEYGHSFTDLADEYTTPFPGFPPCSDVGGGGAACESNVTDETTRAAIKWERWIDGGMMVPSSGAPPTSTDAGLWQGARYLSSGIYRQGFDCMMRSLDRPFCDVASEAYALRLYQGGWGDPAGGIDAIEPGSESPAPGLVVIPGARTFSATVLGPSDGTLLDVKWYLDETLVSSSSAQNGDVVSYPFDEPDGAYALEVDVVDTSTIIHPGVRPTLLHARNWSVIVSSSATTTTTVTVPSSSTTTTVPPPSLCGPQPEPAAACTLADPSTGTRKSFLQIRADLDDDRGDRLKWKWGRGALTDAVEFGEPVAGTPNYSLCIYDASGAPGPLLDSTIAIMAAAPTCSTPPCWKALGPPAAPRGYSYRNRSGAPAGVTAAKLKAGAQGKAKLVLKGRGELLLAPATAPGVLVPPVTIQLLIDAGSTACFQTELPASGVTRQDEENFKGRGP